MNQNDTHNSTNDIEPLDDFERQWVDALNDRDPELLRSEADFVQAVLDRHDAATARPAVIARIGVRVLPYAAAAGLVAAAVVGWSLYSDATAPPLDQPDIADAPNQPPPVDASDAVERPKVALGPLIARAQSAVIQPATGLTDTVQEVPDALSLDGLFNWLGEPLPDVEDILAPLEPDDNQSRA
ncbi:MAG: hypothetical protein ACPGYV_05255 [Phycisphaeraceae bacterium]